MELHGRSVRDDVRELGQRLGDAVRAHEHAAAYDAVEAARTAAIDYRRGDSEDRTALREVVADADAAGCEDLARAFTGYFELVNLAEERERVRAVRRGDAADDLADSVAAAVESLAADGASAADVAGVLEDVRVVPTFTAHPTEARRKTVKAHLNRVRALLEELDERRLTPSERRRHWARIEAIVEALWTTRRVRDRQPTPFDEARDVQWYLANAVYDVVPEVYDELEDALADHYDDPPDVPTVLEFRSWAGSDRDGNPFVTTETTERVLDRQRRLVCERYVDDLDDLAGVLSTADDRVPDDAIADVLAAAREESPRVVESAVGRYPGEPFRQAVAVVRERVDRVTDVRPGGYEDAAELTSDVRDLLAAVRDAGLDRVADEHVAPLARRVETFGLHLAALDLRDHREKHTHAVAEALAAQGVDYAGMDEAERVDFLTEAALQDEPVLDLADTGDVGDEAARVLDRFDALADWHREYGPEAIDAYCISMTEQPSHVLEVVFLADQAGVVALPEHAGVDVVPLLETRSALSNARDILGTLFENDAYGALVDARDGTQEVMLGYSDSNKENGFLAANWQLDRAQRTLAAICEDHGVDVRFFHGRGGSISRGGGPMNEALLALPKETVTGDVKFTQQGESIAETYGNPRVAERELEQMLNAQLRSRHAAVSETDPSLPDDWEAAMETMAETARAAYRDLLETEGFVSYFEAVTPIEVVENLNLGSRPASRSGEREVEDLRAIPWVFSWTQTRCILPGWYGLGAGLAALDDDALLREMYEEWPFFRTTVDNAALALARSEPEIAAEYAALAPEDLRERFQPRIDDEYERAVDEVLSVTDRADLVDREWLRDSLDRRNPYVDPLNLVQVELLSRNHRSETAERALRLSVMGVAAGMQNTG
ncbi:phosphoenolpyruvate carboxylase [Halobacterium yunchengense]|uniref:phosphoenolpyruvate carboxylase n=1 Tax=Halobacterium yunchengense TaxID=3108497 RepID=UPI003009F7BC